MSSKEHLAELELRRGNGCQCACSHDFTRWQSVVLIVQSVIMAVLLIISIKLHFLRERVKMKTETTSTPSSSEQLAASPTELVASPRKLRRRRTRLLPTQGVLTRSAAENSENN
ncbi:MAG: hypothetical protein MHM6MM_003919 [Cercozoa sp. M6MM]